MLRLSSYPNRPILQYRPGSPASFKVSAVGPFPLLYQWTFDGTNINGATSSTLTISNTTSSNLGIRRHNRQSTEHGHQRQCDIQLSSSEYHRFQPERNQPGGRHPERWHSCIQCRWYNFVSPTFIYDFKMMWFLMEQAIPLRFLGTCPGRCLAFHRG